MICYMFLFLIIIQLSVIIYLLDNKNKGEKK